MHLGFHKTIFRFPMYQVDSFAKPKPVLNYQADFTRRDRAEEVQEINLLVYVDPFKVGVVSQPNSNWKVWSLITDTNENINQLN